MGRERTEPELRTSNPSRLPLVGRASLSLALALAFSCGDDEPKEAPAPLGAPTIALSELRPQGGEVVRVIEPPLRQQGGVIDRPEPLVLGCDLRLGVTVALQNWPLRAPGACGTRQCGTVRVSIEPASGGTSAEREAAAASVLVDVASLGDALDGPLKVRAELRRSDGSVPVSEQGAPLADEIEVTFRRESCEPDGAGGAGGTAG